LNKIFLTLTALRGGLKSLWKTVAFWIAKRSGRLSIDEETVDAVRVAFHRSPRYSIRRVTSNKLAIP